MTFGPGILWSLGTFAAHLAGTFGGGAEAKLTQFGDREVLHLQNGQKPAHQLKDPFQALAMRGGQQEAHLFQKGPALGFRAHELLEFLGLTHGWRSFWRKSGFTGYAQSSLIEVRAPVLDLVPRPTERPTQVQLAAR
jgi:hypothetical protein